MTVCRMTRSKVTVTRSLQLEILQFSKSIFSGIFNVSWQMTTDSETMEQYLNFIRTRFLISVLVFVSRDYELGTKFSNFSTDTGSTDCNQVIQVNINMFRFRRSRPSVPHGANFYPLQFERNSLSSPNPVKIG